MHGWQRTTLARRCIVLRIQIQRVTTTSTHRRQLFISPIYRKLSSVRQFARWHAGYFCYVVASFFWLHLNCTLLFVIRACDSELSKVAVLATILKPISATPHFCACKLLLTLHCFFALAHLKNFRPAPLRFPLCSRHIKFKLNKIKPLLILCLILNNCSLQSDDVIFVCYFYCLFT